MRKVEVVPYDPAWPRSFEAETKLLADILGAELVSIHHIGSTSVPGLQAKPIIDMLAEVCNIEALDGLNERMTSVGYTPMGEYGIAGRRYFFKGSLDSHTYHLHAFAEGHPEVARHLLFRDYLRSHPQEARRYASLKESLATKFPGDTEAYAQGKDAFIKEIDRKAAAWSLSGGCSSTSA
ncbi:MAG: GrpB family protein [Dehalococcoidia bacterium]|nr:MAG: GrpB family protein [Dehalococcoidia bacterium]